MKMKMKILRFVASLSLINKPSFYLVTGQINYNRINYEKSDCTKLYNFINRDSKDYANSCCSDFGIECDVEGYITSYSK